MEGLSTQNPPCKDSVRYATGLLAGIAQLSDEFVQLGFKRVEFVLFGAELLVGLDFCCLTLLYVRFRAFEFDFGVVDSISEFLLLPWVLLVA